MTFEDSSRYLSEGTEYVPPRRDTTSFELAVAPAATATPDPNTDPTAALRPTPNLDYVFDDPADGEPGRDRMMVHGLWELVLAIALAVMGYLLYREDSSAFDGSGLRQLALATALVGLAASAMALSLRAGAPNLAVGGVVVLASVYFGQQAIGGTQTAILLTLALSVGVGLVLGAVVAGLHVPGWAAGLAAGLALVGWAATQSSPPAFRGYDPIPHAYYWFAGFCVLSLIASLIGLLPPVRRAVGRFRPVADPARRRGKVAALIVVGALVGSCLLAGGAGLLAVFTRSTLAAGTDGAQVSALNVTALALGAALLGGTSAFGRRGGIFGTIFASALLVVGAQYVTATGRDWSEAAFGALAIALGLGVTRLVERFGRPVLAVRREVDDAWTPRVHSLTPSSLRSSWTATPTPAAGGLWASDDAWGTTESR